METSPVVSKNRQRKKTKPPSRFKEVLAKIGAGMLKYSFSIVMTVLFLAVAIYFYNVYYFPEEAPRREKVPNMVYPEDIILHGNSVQDRQLTLDCLELNSPQNGFEILRSDKADRLRTKSPLIRSVQMKFEPPHRLEIWVEERVPVARLVRPKASEGYWPALAVDEEGCLFTYPKSLQAYPEIGTQAFARHAEPGAQWPDEQRCVLHLIAAMRNYSFAGKVAGQSSEIKSVALLGNMNDPDDGLLVTLLDGRQITIAWPKMSMETEPSEAMHKRLQRLSVVMSDPATAGLTHFNAMAEDRIAGSE